jgi:dTDP-glucose 4,6-dehydratase
MRALVTGGAGFIGHHLIDALLSRTNWEIVTLDRFDISGTPHRLAEILQDRDDRERLRVVWHDLKAPISDSVSARVGEVDYVFHLAAASHVDRSIAEPSLFVLDNVLGTTHLLEWAVKLPALKHFFYFSTDEVFGPANAGQQFREWDRYHCGNPYAATKAGAEEMCLAFQNTFKLPVSIIHCMNVYGIRQHHEKYIPSCVRKILNGEEVMVHSSPRMVPGSRFYMHARSVADALLFLLPRAQVGEKYNFVGPLEVDNLTLALTVADALGKPLRYRLVDFHSSRPGHDLRYALDGTVMRELGFMDPHPDTLHEIRKVAIWTAEHPQWLR